MVRYDFGMAATLLTIYEILLIQWGMLNTNPSKDESVFETTRERSFRTLSLLTLSSNRLTTSSMFGRLDGSS